MDLDRLTDSFKDEVRVESNQQKRNELTLLKKERKVPGHTMFSFNIKTGEIKKATLIYSDTVLFPSGRPLHQPKLIIEANCIYRQALNARNFIKRLNREGIHIAIK